MLTQRIFQIMMSLCATLAQGTKNPAATGTDSFTSLVSYLDCVMYNYAEKYYLTASIRVDGRSSSSRTTSGLPSHLYLELIVLPARSL